MGRILRMGEASRPAGAAVHFDRAELCSLLGLYSRRVAAGEWRDYAIGQRVDRAVFAVYRHTLDRPLFTIAKIGGPGRPAGWEVASGPRTLCRADSLEDVLRVFDRSLRLITL